MFPQTKKNHSADAIARLQGACWITALWLYRQYSIEGQGVKLEGVKFIELETERASTKEESGLTSVLKTEQGGEAPKPLSKNSIAQASGESNANEAAVLKTTLKRLIEQVSSAPPNRHMRLKNFVQFS